MTKSTKEYSIAPADHFRLGNALAEQGHYEEAARHFSTLICHDPELDDPMSVPGISALMCLAQCKGALGNWKEAVNTAAPAMGTAVQVIAHFAWIVQKSGNYHRAAFLFTLCTQLAPDHPRFLHGAGYNKMRLGLWEPALADLGQALKLEPESAEIWYDFGSTLSRMGKKKESRPVFRKVLRLDPRFCLAWYDLACLDALARRASAAFRNLNRAVDCGFSDLPYLMADPDFAAVQGDPRWGRVLQRIDRKSAKKTALSQEGLVPVAVSTDTIQ